MKCEGCKFWKYILDADFDHCCDKMREETKKNSGLICFDMGYEFQEVFTEPDFGCVLFEPKLKS